MILLKQMLILLFFMALGYGMARKRILDQNNCKFLSWLIVNVANPALILSGSIGNQIGQKELTQIIVLAIVFYVALIGVSELLVMLLRMEKKEAGMYKVMLAFTNMGFMGFPILSAMYGSTALLYGAAFMLLFNLLIYTYGIFRIAGTVGSWRDVLKKFLNIGVFAGILSLTIAFSGFEVPAAASQTIIMLSNLTAPLSMMVIGASFLDVEWKGVFWDARLLAFVFMRLLLIPVLGMLVLRQVVHDPLLLGVCFVTLATPSGSMAAMLARQYDGDYITASKGIGLTTILSVITMPLLFAVFHLQ